jgi:predicted acetyltransferase
MEEPHLISGFASDQSTALLEALNDLSNIVWPKTPDTPEIEMPSVEERPDRYIAAIEYQGEIVAEAESFSRTIAFNKEKMRIQALASVCTHPNHRHKGYASILVKEIFKLVDNGHYPLSFWQTGVPDFYLTLGARLVGNRFYNSLHPTNPDKNPFWDDYIMIYPKNSTKWPKGDIDTLGLGF